MKPDWKGVALLLLDVAAVCAASLGANYLRFDEIYPSEFPHFGQWLLLDVIITPIVFYALGLYRGGWRYASVSDVKRILLAVGVRTIALFVLFIFLGFDRGVPRSTTILQAMLLLCAVGGARFLTRVRREITQQKRLRTRPPVLLIGAGDAGEILLRELRNNDALPYNPVGLIDDDPARWGEQIHGVPVLGGTADIPVVAAERRIREAIIAIPTATGPQLTRIYKACRAAGIRAKTVPPVSDLFQGRVSVSQIREVEVEDLLGREPVRVDLDMIRSRLAGRRVLVTGGAGSIGRELARQLAALAPERLVVMDRNENASYFTEIELRKRFPSVPVDCRVGDVLDRGRLEQVLEECRPHVVFHAAAFKHVPMMESHAVEAFKNNVLGTRNVAQAAAAIGVERFVLISTDKAVHPVSVMGGTKRLSEMVLQEMRVATRFVSVRFGNVLGSDGSVVPLFKRQISEGGPLTVTHPEVSRYFMTVTEAVNLVLQAAGMGVGGEVYLLDMGEPIKILDLARKVIELSGFRPDEEIEIVYTGLRPGEKLHEELYVPGEEWERTSHPKILKFRHAESAPGILPRVSLLEQDLGSRPPADMEVEVRRTLADLIPDFRGPVPEDTPRSAAGELPARAAAL